VPGRLLFRSAVVDGGEYLVIFGPRQRFVR